MIVGIDCIALPVNFSGAAYYIINLTLNLLRAKRAFGIQIYCKTGHTALFKNHLKEGDSIVEINIKNKLQQILYYEKMLSQKLVQQNVDVFLAMHYITPQKNPKYKIITIFHDMGFILHPHYYPFLKRIYFQLRIPVYIQRSDKIVAVSQNTLCDLVREFKSAGSKSLCIYPGTDHMRNIEIKHMNSHTDAKPFVLAVNSFEKRKNIPLILDTFNILKSKYSLDYNLFLIGRNNNHSKYVQKKRRKSPFRDFIFILPGISSEQLKGLYQKAGFFICTSKYEGFGFTPIEAVTENCPVFLYPNKAGRELFKDHPYLIDSSNPEIWAEKIHTEMNLNFPDKLKSDTFKNMSWEKCAAEFASLIETL